MVIRDTQNALYCRALKANPNHLLPYTTCEHLPHPHPQYTYTCILVWLLVMFHFIYSTGKQRGRQFEYLVQ